MLHCTGALTDTLQVDLIETHVIDYTLGCNVYVIKFIISSPHRHFLVSKVSYKFP